MWFREDLLPICDISGVLWRFAAFSCFLRLFAAFCGVLQRIGDERERATKKCS